MAELVWAGLIIGAVLGFLWKKDLFVLSCVAGLAGVLVGLAQCDWEYFQTLLSRRESFFMGALILAGYCMLYLVPAMLAALGAFGLKARWLTRRPPPQGP